MISDPIADHQQAAILLRQILFAWTALGKKNRSQDPLEEIVSEWNAGTGEIVFSRSIGDREFNWLPKGKKLVGKLKGKSFKNVPEMVSFRANCETDLTDNSLGNFEYWLNAIERHLLDGSGLVLALKCVCPADDQHPLAASTWGIRCSETRRGRAEIPYRFTLSSLNSISIGVEKLIEKIGVDNDLYRILGDEGERMMRGNGENGLNKALSGAFDSELFARVFTTFKEAIVPGSKVCFSIFCSLKGNGYLLTDDFPDPSDFAFELAQKEKMDRLLNLILNSKSGQKWELVINSVSERKTCGAGWDRRGSVLEHHDTKIEVTRLRSGRKQHKVILHYREGEYRIEIDGLDADSEAGRIFSGWGVPFH